MYSSTVGLFEPGGASMPEREQGNRGMDLKNLTAWNVDNPSMIIFLNDWIYSG